MKAGFVDVIICLILVLEHHGKCDVLQLSCIFNAMSVKISTISKL